MPLFKLTVHAADRWVGVVDDVATIKSFETVVANILSMSLPLAGLVVFVMIMLSGFKLLTAGGNPEQIKKATGTLTWSVFGLVIIISIWLLFMFLEEFTGLKDKLTIFELPGP